MKRAAFAVGLSVMAAATWADEPLSGPEFDAYTQGKTMTYAQGGTVWGREQYLPGARVIWAFEGQDCKRGAWHEAAPGLICFAYQDNPADLECWRFFHREGKLFAQPDGADNAAPLAAIEETNAPLACPGPDLGV